MDILFERHLKHENQNIQPNITMDAILNFWFAASNFILKTFDFKNRNSYFPSLENSIDGILSSLVFRSLADDCSSNSVTLSVLSFCENRIKHLVITHDQIFVKLCMNFFIFLQNFYKNQEFSGACKKYSNMIKTCFMKKVRIKCYKCEVYYFSCESTKIHAKAT